MNISNVAVVGAGTMGSSIVVALIGAGYSVLLKEVNETFLKSGLDRIDKYQASRVKKGLSQSKADEERARLTTTLDYSLFSSVDLVIEAAPEDIKTKTSVFQELEKACKPQAILATNTSSLSISQIAAQTATPQRVIGLHFFNPAHIMKLVEIIPGLDTAPDTVATAMSFVESLGKLPVRVEECASFLVNRLLGRYMNESLFCLQEKAGGVAEIDEAACRFAMPIGPLALRDMNGADIGLAVAKFNFDEYGERFRPPDILQAMVDKNWLGQKTGRGFYLYDSETKKRTQPNPQLDELIKCRDRHSAEPLDARRLFMPMINEAFLVLQEKICDACDLDPALKAGLGMRKGPLELAQEMGLPACVKEMQRLFDLHGERFRPAPLLKRYAWAGKQSVV